MDPHSLMRKLIEIERTLGERDACEIRKMILAAQDGVLQLERENEELALRNAGLRLRLQGIRSASLPLVAHSLNAAAESTDATPVTSGDESPCGHICAGSTNAGQDGDAHPGVWRTTHFFFS